MPQIGYLQKVIPHRPGGSGSRYCQFGVFPPFLEALLWLAEAIFPLCPNIALGSVHRNASPSSPYKAMLYWIRSLP